MGLERRARSISAIILAGAIVAAPAAACGIDATGMFTPGAGGGASEDAANELDAATSDAPTSSDGADVQDAPAEPVFPSNVPEATLMPDAAPLANVIEIDTSDPLRIDTGSGLSSSPPAGVLFGVHDAGPSLEAGVAVLSTGAFSVGVPLRVSGARPLVIVAAGPVLIDSPMEASARGRRPGPGGFGPGLGPGKGLPGTRAMPDDSGGSGAGHRMTGAAGGKGAGLNGPNGGAAYDVMLVGGSGGGVGSPVNTTCGDDGTGNLGGGGGGAVQIFSAQRIVVGGSGGIDVGGGGGRHGCNGICSGGGGGSGGFILLEAPAISIAGFVTANGGGGGGGQSNTNDGNGSDGLRSTAAADGGVAGADAAANGGSGGTAIAPTKPADATTNAGGGGGAAGRIRVRTRGVPADRDGGVVSPPGDYKTDL